MSRSFFGGLVLVASFATAAPAATFPEQFVAGLDLAAPGMETAARLARSGKTDSVLIIWRNQFLRRLRVQDMGQFGWHSYQTHPRPLSFATFLVDSISEAAYRAQSFGYDWVDSYGWRGRPGTIGTINWVAPLAPSSSPDYTKDVYGTWKMFTPLATKYHLTRSGVYLDKYFEIAGQFCRNQKTQIMALPAASRTGYDCDWSQNAQVALDQGFRIHQMVRQLALIAKSLQPDDPRPAWDLVLAPLARPISDAALARVDAEVLARIAWSLVADHPYSMFWRFQKAGAVPNQRMEGLSALSMYGALFPEFRVVRDSLVPMVDVSMQDHISGSTFRDGGFLEQSFNYNTGDLGAMDELLSLWGGPTESVRMPVPKSLVLMRERSLGFRRLLALSLDPFGQMPRNGNNGTSIKNDAWASGYDWTKARIAATSSFESQIRSGHQDPLLDQVKAALSGATSGAPALTSAAFPHVGYYSLRRDWTNHSPWLWMNGARASRGHDSPDAGAIQVAAGARQFLVGSGVQWYNTTMCPSALRPEFDNFNAYFDEGSGWKSSTVLCDSTAQKRGTTNVAPSSFRDGLWSTSDRFDLVTTRFTEGYGSITDAIHQRTVIQLRGLDGWIVSDRLTGAKAHNWTQVWNFSPEFAAGVVSADATTRTIRTSVASGPSWSQAFHATAPVVMNSHHGNKNGRYLGWWKTDMGSTPVPKTDIHVGVRGDTAILASLVAIRPAGTQAFPTRRDSSDAHRAGFETTLEGGTTLRFQECRHVSCPLSWNGTTSNARATLVRRDPSGDLSGLVLGSSDGVLGLQGRKLSFPFRDFEWSLQGSQWTAREIKAPDTFGWTTDASPRQVLWTQAPRTVSGTIGTTTVDRLRESVGPGRIFLVAEPDGPVSLELLDVRGALVFQRTLALHAGWNALECDPSPRLRLARVKDGQGRVLGTARVGPSMGR